MVYFHIKYDYYNLTKRRNVKNMLNKNEGLNYVLKILQEQYMI